VSESPSEKDRINIKYTIRGGVGMDFCCSGENMYKMRTGFDKIEIINILVGWGGVGGDSGVECVTPVPVRSLKLSTLFHSQ